MKKKIRTDGLKLTSPKISGCGNLLFLLFIVIFFQNDYAKTAIINKLSNQSTINGTISKEQIKIFEQKLTPFFEMKADAQDPADFRGYRPSDMDIFFLARRWDMLSSAFRELYLKAIQIPDSFSVYNSPGGHFSIYYTTHGAHSINPTTDSIGYARQGDSWRTLSIGPNSIPDYVEEVAWSFDSAWSMEIERFGFEPGFPSFSTERYKVMVCEPGYSIYGYTFPKEKAADSQIGYKSYVQIRSNWDGWNENEIIDYQDHPEKGIRITAVHEFFHAFQYSSVWNDYLDDFPYAWLEATAVMMEDLGFDYVNDYLQYLSTGDGDGYFDRPTESLLTDFGFYYIYTNSILALYLYSFCGATPSVDFFKTVFENNSLNPISFHDNLTNASLSLGTSWPVLLNRFHTGSYFTAGRADTTLFYKDAGLMDSCEYPDDDLDENMTLSKRVKPYSMQTFSLLPDGIHGDSVFVEIPPVSSYSDMQSQRSMHLILTDTLPGTRDSVIQIQATELGAAFLQINEWQKYEKALFIVTNAHPSASDSVCLFFLPGSWSRNNAYDTLTASDTIGSPIYSMGVVEAVPGRSILGDISIEAVSPDENHLAAMDVLNLTAAGTFYRISFPEFWPGSVEMGLTISMPGNSINTLDTEFGVTAPFASLYHYNDRIKSWDKIGYTPSVTGDSAVWRCSIEESGVYAILQPALDKWRVYPNPVRLHTNRPVTFEGSDILQVSIYTINGNLIVTASRDNYNSLTAFSVDRYSFAWKVVNSAGKAVVPGTYIAMIGYTDPRTRGMKLSKQKILVLP